MNDTPTDKHPCQVAASHAYNIATGDAQSHPLAPDHEHLGCAASVLLRYMDPSEPRDPADAALIAAAFAYVEPAQSAPEAQAELADNLARLEATNIPELDKRLMVVAYERAAGQAPELHVDASPYLRQDGTLDMRRVRADADDALMRLDTTDPSALQARSILAAILDSVPA